MALSDLLYPDNPKKRQEIQQLIGGVQSNTKRIWSSTNDLIQIYNERIYGEWKNVSKEIENIDPLMNVDDIPKERKMSDLADELSKTLDKIKDNLNKIDEERKGDDIDPKLLEKIKQLDTEDTLEFIKNLNDVKNSIKIATGAALSIVWGAVLKQVCKRFTKIIAKVLAGALVSLLTAGIGVAIDVIFEAIWGAVERNKLDEELKKIRKPAADYEIDARDYCERITAMKIQIIDGAFEPKKDCIKCGKTLALDDNFCGKCGTKQPAKMVLSQLTQDKKKEQQSTMNEQELQNKK